MLTIAGFSQQHGPLGNSSGYVHIYDDETDIEVVHTFELSGYVDKEVLLSAFNSGNTTYFSTVDKG